MNLGIKDIYPGKEMEKRMPGLIVRIGNDPNIAALGEMWQGGGICFLSLWVQEWEAALS